jgi:hypothetical protein
MQSAWYLRYENQSTQSPELLIALLNRGSSPIEVKEVIVNENKSPRFEWVRTSPFKLEPGQIIVMAGGEFELRGDKNSTLSSIRKKKGGSNEGESGHQDAKCWLPVTVSVVTASNSQQTISNDRIQTQGGLTDRLLTELFGRMPSSLPDEWADQCTPKFDQGAVNK